MQVLGVVACVDLHGVQGATRQGAVRQRPLASWCQGGQHSSGTSAAAYLKYDTAPEITPLPPSLTPQA